jgi:hypothetical protein
MGRVFTVNFHFKEQPITALVNLRENEYNLTFLVRYLNKEPAHLLSGGKIEFSLTSLMDNKAIEYGNPGEELLFYTTEAITNYLQAH